MQCDHSTTRITVTCAQPAPNCGSPVFSRFSDALSYIAGSDAAAFEVLLPDAVYMIGETIHLDVSLFRNVKKQIRFIGTHPAQTVLSGARLINVQWQPYQDGIWYADIGAGLKIDGLYIRGERQVMARYPNEQSGATLGGYAADALAPERVARWHNPAGGYVRALHDREWGGNSYLIEGKDEHDQLILRWVGDNNRGSGMHPVKRMVENIFEELDSPGEWFYDPKAGRLFYYPVSEASLAAGDLEIVTTAELFRLTGQAGHPISGISFENLHFTKTHRTLFTGQYERPLRGDWGMVRQAAVFMEQAEGIAILNCRFSDMGGNAVAMSGYNQGNLVDRCDFTHIGATGVLIFGCMSAVRDPSTYDGDRHKTTISDFVPGPKDDHYPRQIRISNSYFYDIGTFEKQTAAVGLSICQSVIISRNTIHHTSRAGINIHDGTFGGHLIEDNDLFDCVTETADHGPINCWGRDRFWSVPQHDAQGLFGLAKRPFARLDAVKTSIIRHNRIHGNHSFGIDIDDGASNYDISENLCLGVGIKLRDGFDRTVYNNLLIGSRFEIHCSFASNNDLIYTNIVCNNSICNTIMINEGATTYFGNNLYWNLGHQVKDLPASDWQSSCTDPLLADLVQNDFSLLPSSPAISQGFIPFPAGDADFGRADCPKPPRLVYADMPDETGCFQFFDVAMIDAITEGIRSATGLPDRQGIYIADRATLGVFSALGLPIGKGDVLRQIGSARIGSVQDFLAAFDQIPLDQPIVIEIFRHQKPLQIVFIKNSERFNSQNNPGKAI